MQINVINYSCSNSILRPEEISIAENDEEFHNFSLY